MAVVYQYARRVKDFWTLMAEQLWDRLHRPLTYIAEPSLAFYVLASSSPWREAALRCSGESQDGILLVWELVGSWEPPEVLGDGVHPDRIGTERFLQGRPHLGVVLVTDSFVEERIDGEEQVLGKLFELAGSSGGEPVLRRADLAGFRFKSHWGHRC